MTGIGLWWAGLSPNVKRAALIVAVLIVLGVTLYACGGRDERNRTEARDQKAVTKTTAVTTDVQRRLDQTTADIGAEVLVREVETVRYVERVKTEIRDVVAKEADPLPRLTAWRDRIERLRVETCLDGPDRAERTDACRDPGALQGARASDR